MEYFDIRKADGTITGIIKERSLVHQDGDLHGTVHIFIARPHGTSYDLLLQKRSKDKDAWPGCYDISSAGHLSAGQDFMEAALRELEEELGITADESDLHFIGYHEGFSEETFYDKPFRNHELSAVYLYTREIHTSQLILQEEEVESVRWFPLEVCLKKAAAQDKNFCLFEDEIKMVKNSLLIYNKSNVPTEQ